MSNYVIITKSDLKKKLYYYGFHSPNITIHDFIEQKLERPLSKKQYKEGVRKNENMD